MSTTLLDPPAAPADVEPAAAAPRLLSIDEFEELPDRKQYELIDGVLLEKEMSTRSSETAGNCFELLSPFVRRHKLGRVFPSDAGYILFSGRSIVRFPDVSFIRADRLPPNRPSYWRLAPDFAFEAVSPTDKGEDIVAKVEEYLRAGVPLVWVAYPLAKVVHAYRADGRAERFAEGGTLSAEELFPGWSAPVTELFADA